jgi:hypothetical protein
MHHSASILQRILTLMIKKSKAIEIDEIHFTTHMNTFDSNMFLALKIMNFEDVVLTKIIHFYVIKEHDNITYMI